MVVYETQFSEDMSHSIFYALGTTKRTIFLKKSFRVYHFSKLQFEKNQFTYICAFIYIGQFL